MKIYSIGEEKNKIFLNSEIKFVRKKIFEIKINYKIVINLFFNQMS